jgi:malonyl CoA-acyl carrier protein transacylase
MDEMAQRRPRSGAGGSWLAMFPGQGSQRVGMGRSLAQRHPAAAEVFDRASAAIDADLRELCWDSPIEVLTATQNAQPALTTVSLAAYAAFAADRPAPGSAGFAGHSIGAIAAASAAGCLDVEDAVRLARARGELMAAAPGEGSMLAVALGRGVAPEDVPGAGAQLAARYGLDLAAINGPRQVVLSGPGEAVREAARLIGPRSKELRVSHAFHSRLMAPGQPRWDQLLDGAAFGDPVGAYFAGSTGRGVRGGDQVREDLRRGLCEPVLWAAVMEAAGDFDELIAFGTGAAIAALARPYLRQRRLTLVESSVP